MCHIAINIILFYLFYFIVICHNTEIPEIFSINNYEKIIIYANKSKSYFPIHAQISIKARLIWLILCIFDSHHEINETRRDGKRDMVIQLRKSNQLKKTWLWERSKIIYHYYYWLYNYYLAPITLSFYLTKIYTFRRQVQVFDVISTQLSNTIRYSLTFSTDKKILIEVYKLQKCNLILLSYFYNAYVFCNEWILLNRKLAIKELQIRIA